MRKVAVMKQQYEEKIESFLEQLSREFPRLEILDDVFPSTDIQRLVAAIYQGGIHFARECTRYYSRSSAGIVVCTICFAFGEANPRIQEEWDTLQSPLCIQ